MTKKKRQRKEERNHAHGHHHQPQHPALGTDVLDDDLAGLPADPRAMERMTSHISRLLSQQGIDSEAGINEFMNDFVLAQGHTLDDMPKPETPLDQAQEIIYDAFDTEDSHKRVRLARKALKTSPDCADAYVILAEETAESADQAKALYQKGVEAGERALGEQRSPEAGGDFWITMETRPYMRARQGLAQAQWALGEQDQALANYREMLELNPGDNQGIRYSLAACLQVTGRDDELEALLEQYPDDAAAFWTYTRALMRFRGEGNSKHATSALKQAIDINPHVALYLLGRKNVLVQAFQDINRLGTFGDEGEAASYFISSLPNWLKVHGAIDWVRDHVDEKTLLRLEQKLA